MDVVLITVFALMRKNLFRRITTRMSKKTNVYKFIQKKTPLMFRPFHDISVNHLTSDAAV